MKAPMGMVASAQLAATGIFNLGGRNGHPAGELSGRAVLPEIGTQSRLLDGLSLAPGWGRFFRRRVTAQIAL